MAAQVSTALKARKQPQQARSQVTVDAIFDATIQVLLADGLQRLTTIRVAARAGVSVGTLYQYYPNKQSLLLDVLRRHLVRIGDSMDIAALAVRGSRMATMVPAVVDAFVSAKTAHVDESRSLFAVAMELDSRELRQAAERRGRGTLAAMLASACDVRFDDVDMVSFVFFTAMVGLGRPMIEGSLSKKELQKLREHLQSLCLGYLQREARPR